MSALAEVARAYVPVIATEAGQKARAQVLAIATRHGCAVGSYRCSVCKGRVDVEVAYKRGGAIKRSKGTCRTPGCIAWED